MNQAPLEPNYMLYTSKQQEGRRHWTDNTSTQSTFLSLYPKFCYDVLSLALGTLIKYWLVSSLICVCKVSSNSFNIQKEHFVFRIMDAQCTLIYCSLGSFRFNATLFSINCDLKNNIIYFSFSSFVFTYSCFFVL